MSSTYGLWADNKPDEEDSRREQNLSWKWLQDSVAYHIEARVSQGLTTDEARVIVHNKIGCNMSLFLLITNKWVLECPDGCRSFIAALAMEVEEWPNP